MRGVNGRGYPFHPDQQHFSIEARVISVADVFQALVQDRPYRPGMQLEQVVEILDEFSASGKLDSDVVECAKADRDHCFQIALGQAEENQGNEVPVFMREMFEA